MRKTVKSRFGLLVAVFIGTLFLYSPVVASIDDSKCIECHDEFDHEAYSASAHGRDACNSCHFDVVDIEVHEDCGSSTQEKVETCHRCHPVEGGEHFASVHMINDVRCADCHSEIHTAGLWDGNKQGIVEMCIGCHDGEDYGASVHGQAVRSGNLDAPSCADCHGLHLVKALGDPATRAFREFHTTTCHRCHSDAEMMERNGMVTMAVATYGESYHGKAGSFGSALAAGCADCHSGHKVLKADNPESTLHPDNLLATCAECHPGSTFNFSQFYAHADHADKENYPLLYYTYITMTALLVSVFAVFWVHTFLWWRRAYWSRHENVDSWEFHHPAIDEPLRPYRRFTWYDKVQHFLMATSFIGLVVTGAPLKFSSAPWAHAIIDLLGGLHMAGYIHRVCAVVTFFYFGSCCLYVLYYFFLKKSGGSLLQRLFGPDSLFPNLRDVNDIKGMLRWFFRGGKEPTFERWTYWEKFDFLAVFWGMFAIGGSGLLLWFPEFFSQFMPGWVFNVAIIVHSDEALLASGFIFTVHFFNTHFRPGKFPMDMVIFRGWIPKVEMWEERGDWVKRLESEGRLDELKTKRSNPLQELAGRIFGFAALGIGIGCVILIIWGFMAH